MQVARERLEEDEGALVAQSVQRADKAQAHVEQTRARLVDFGTRARHALAVATPRQTHVALQRLLVLCPVPQSNILVYLCIQKNYSYARTRSMRVSTSSASSTKRGH